MANDVKYVLIELDQLPPDSRREVGHAAMLNQLLGKTCAQCGFKYETEADLERHGALGGYDGEIVGIECWNKYVAANRGSKR